MEDYPCDYLVVGSALSVVVVVQSLVVLGVGCYLLWWFREHLDHKVIRLSQPLFCQLFLVGLLLSSLTNYLSLGRASDAMCLIRMWCFNLTFTLTFGPILAKMYRVYALFVSPKKLQRRSLNNRQMAWIILLLLVFDAGLLVIWTVWGGAGKEIIFHEISDLIRIPRETCGGSESLPSHLLSLFNLLLILLSFFLSHVNRSIETTISESTYVNHAMCNAGCLMGVYTVMWYTVQVSVLSVFESDVLSRNLCSCSCSRSCSTHESRRPERKGSVPPAWASRNLRLGCRSKAPERMRRDTAIVVSNGKPSATNREWHVLA